MKPAPLPPGLPESPAPADVDRFIAGNEFPLVDEEGVTFVYRGDASSVRLRTWVHGLPESLPLERVTDTDLWMLRLELPAGSRIEYKLDVLGARHDEWITDPLNPHVAPDPFGANSVCRASGYRPSAYAIEAAGVPRGRVDELAIGTAGGERAGALRVYVPARFRRTRRYPLLLAHDGSDFLLYAHLATVLDNLCHRRDLPDMIVALHDPTDRTAEYAASDDHRRDLGETLLPALERAFPLDPDPATRGLLGASLGAVASLHAAWADPARWGRLMLLSGSFAFSDIGPHGRSPLFDPVARFVNALRHEPGRLARRTYLSCGRYESLIDENRALASFLHAHGFDVRYREVPDGHHWQNWRDRLGEGLAWLFPGPSWMVY